MVRTIIWLLIIIMMNSQQVICANFLCIQVGSLGVTPVYDVIVYGMGMPLWRGIP